MVWISLIFVAAVTAAARARKPLIQPAPLRNAAPPADLRKSRRDQPLASPTMLFNLRQPTLAAVSGVSAPPVPSDFSALQRVLKRKEESDRCEQCRPVPAH